MSNPSDDQAVATNNEDVKSPSSKLESMPKEELIKVIKKQMLASQKYKAKCEELGMENELLKARSAENSKPDITSDQWECMKLKQVTMEAAYKSTIEELNKFVTRNKDLENQLEAMSTTKQCLLEEMEAVKVSNVKLLSNVEVERNSRVELAEKLAEWEKMMKMLEKERDDARSDLEEVKRSCRANLDVLEGIVCTVEAVTPERDVVAEIGGGRSTRGGSKEGEEIDMFSEFFQMEECLSRRIEYLGSITAGLVFERDEFRERIHHFLAEIAGLETFAHSSDDELNRSCSMESGSSLLESLGRAESAVKLLKASLADKTQELSLVHEKLNSFASTENPDTSSLVGNPAKMDSGNDCQPTIERVQEVLRWRPDSGSKSMKVVYELSLPEGGKVDQDPEINETKYLYKNAGERIKLLEEKTAGLMEERELLLSSIMQLQLALSSQPVEASTKESCTEDSELKTFSFAGCMGELERSRSKLSLKEDAILRLETGAQEGIIAISGAWEADVMRLEGIAAALEEKIRRLEEEVLIGGKDRRQTEIKIFEGCTQTEDTAESLKGSKLAEKKSVRVEANGLQHCPVSEKLIFEIGILTEGVKKLKAIIDSESSLLEDLGQSEISCLLEEIASLGSSLQEISFIKSFQDAGPEGSFVKSEMENDVSKKLKKSFLDLETTLDEKQSRNDVSEDSLEKLLPETERVSVTISEVDSFREELKNITEELNRARSRMASLSEEVESLKARSEMEQLALESSKSDLKLARDKLELTQVDLEKVKKEAESLLSELCISKAECKSLQSELAQTKELLASKETEFESVRESLESMNADMTLLKSELESTKMHSDSVKAIVEQRDLELGMVRSELEAARLELDSSQLKLDDLMSQIQSMESDFDSLQAELKSTKEELEWTRSALEEVRGELAKARSEMESNSFAAESAQESLRLDSIVVKSQLERSLWELEDSRHKLDSIVSELESARSELERHQDECLGLRGNLEEKENELKKIEEALETERARCGHAEGDLKVQEEQLRLLVEERNDLQKHLESKESELYNSQRQVESKEDEAGDLRKLLASRESELNDLHKHLKLMENELGDLRKQLELKENVYEDLQKQFEHKENELSHLRKQLSSRERELEDLEKLKNHEFDNFKKHLESKEFELSDLRKRLESREKELVDVEKRSVKEEDVEQLRFQLVEKEERESKMKQLILKNKKDTAELKSKLESTIEELNRVRLESANQKTSDQSVSMLYQNLQREYERLESDYDVERSASCDLRKSVELLNSELGRAKVKVAEVLEEADNLKEEVVRRDKKLQLLEESKLQAEKEIQAGRIQCDAIIKEKSQLDARVLQLESQLGQVQDQHQLELRRLEQELKAKADELESAKKDVQHSQLVSLEIADYERTLRSLKSALEDSEAKVKIVQDELLHAQQQKSATVKLLEAAENQLKQSEEQCGKLKQMLLKLKKDLSDSRKQEGERANSETQLRTQNEMLIQLTEEQKLKTAELVSENWHLSERLGTLSESHRKTVSLLETKLNDQTKEAEQNKSALVRLRAEYDGYKVRVHNVLKVKKGSNLDEDTLVEEKRERERLEQLNNQLKDKLSELRNQLSVMTTESDQLKEELEKLLERQTLLKANHEAMEAAWKEKLDKLMASHALEKAKLSETVQQLMIQNENMAQTFKEQHSTVVESLREQLDKAQLEVDRCRTRLQSLDHSPASVGQAHSSDSSGASGKSYPTLPLMEGTYEERQAAEGSEYSEDALHSGKMVRSSPVLTHQALNRSSFVPLDVLLSGHSNVPSEATDEDAARDYEKEEKPLSSMLLASQRQGAHLRQLLNESEATVLRLSEQASILKAEIRRLERNQERQSSVSNMEYLKNIVYKFLTLKSTEERLQLIPVMQTMLKFSPEEKEQVTSIAKGTDSASTSGAEQPGWSSYIRWPNVSLGLGGSQ